MSSHEPSEKSHVALALIVFTVLLIIPIVMGVAYYNIASGFRQQSIDRVTTETNLAASALQIKLNHLTQLATTYAELPALSAAAAAGRWEDAAAVARDSENEVTLYDPYIDRVILFDKSGTEQSAYPTLVGGIGADASSGAWYKTITQTNAPVVPPVALRAAKPSFNVVNVAAPIYGGTAKDHRGLSCPADPR